VTENTSDLTFIFTS